MTSTKFWRCGETLRFIQVFCIIVCVCVFFRYIYIRSSFSGSKFAQLPNSLRQWNIKHFHLVSYRIVCSLQLSVIDRNNARQKIKLMEKICVGQWTRFDMLFQVSQSQFLPPFLRQTTKCGVAGDQYSSSSLS